MFLLLHLAQAFTSVRLTVISPQSSQNHAGMRWPHQIWREMHQSLMFRIQSKYVFSHPLGKNCIRPSSTALIAGSASGCVLTNHWGERDGSPPGPSRGDPARGRAVAVGLGKE